MTTEPEDATNILPVEVEAETSPEHHPNSTDATRGEPLVQRALKRKAELVALLAALPEDAARARGDIETAIATVDDLLTGDLAHVSNMTSAQLSRWLETNKHLAELA